MTLENSVKEVLESTLHLNGRSAQWADDAPLLGSLPELDSLAVVEVVSGLEKKFGFHFDDEDINGDTFATLKSLVNFIDQKLKSP